MDPRHSFIDIHCHLVPGIDDGAKSWDEALDMARIAVADGITTTIVTPHQLGAFGHNSGDIIRQRTLELQQVLDERQIPLQVLPGGDVRIEENLPNKLKSGEVLTLADHGKHVLLELPHELYFPFDSLLHDLERAGITAILSHPERNQGLLKQFKVVAGLVERGCLMQVTAGSLLGAFGPHCQQMTEAMLEQGLVHFVATDAHGAKSRRPLIRRAFQRIAEIVGQDEAEQICCHHPATVAAGRNIVIERVPRKTLRSLGNWFGLRKAG